jgi:hypothetical protein
MTAHDLAIVISRAVIDCPYSSNSYFFLEELFLEEPLREEVFREDAFREEPFLRGTFAPSLRACDSPMAMACLRLEAFLPDLPLFSVPLFRSCIACFTFCCAFLPYLAILHTSNLLACKRNATELRSGDIAKHSNRTYLVHFVPLCG